MRQGVRFRGVKVVVKKDGRRYVYRRTPQGLVALRNLPENDHAFLKHTQPQERRKRRSAEMLPRAA